MGLFDRPVEKQKHYTEYRNCFLSGKGAIDLVKQDFQCVWVDSKTGKAINFVATKSEQEELELDSGAWYNILVRRFGRKPFFGA